MQDLGRRDDLAHIEQDRQDFSAGEPAHDARPRTISRRLEPRLPFAVNSQKINNRIAQIITIGRLDPFPFMPRERLRFVGFPLAPIAARRWAFQPVLRFAAAGRN
jgi:hypothetical protein